MNSQVDMDVVAKDVPKAICFLKDIADAATDMDITIKNLTEKVQEGGFDSLKGLSLLDLKCHVMLSYLINMCHLVLRKCHGNPIEGDPSILRLVEHRTVLEKMRPIEQKLKYYIDKLVKVSTGVVSSKDPLSYRANPRNLISKLDGDEDGDDEVEDGKGEKKSKDQMRAYVPPKLTSVPYDGDNGNEAREKRRLEQARKRALSSTIMRELKAEYFEGPEEIKDRGDSVRKKESQDAKRKREYEEEFMTRFPVTKKEKALEKRQTTMNSLDGLTHFGDTSFLTSDEKGEGFALPQKKPNVTKKVKSGAKKGAKKGSKKGLKRFKKGKRK